MKPKLLCSFLLSILISYLPGIEGNLLTHKQTHTRPHYNVYFPVLPDDITKVFGGKLLQNLNAVPEKVKETHHASESSEIPEIALPKHITHTTEVLPLAQESYVVNEAVTEPPGPSYLTDSVYYNEEHGHSTKRPDSQIELTKNTNDQKNQQEPLKVSEGLGEDHSKEDDGEKSALFIKKYPSYLYYIPTSSSDLEESKHVHESSEISGELSVEKLRDDDQKLKTIDSSTKAHPIIVKEHNSSSSDDKTQSLKSSSQEREVDDTKNEDSEQTTPNPTSTESSISKVISPLPKNTDGYLPKPAPNPFVPKISKSVINPNYKSLKSPVTSTTIQTETTGSKTNTDSIVPTQATTSNTHILKSSQTEEQQATHPSLAHFGIGTNKASGSAHIHQYTTYSQSEEKKESPVYRTSSKSYRPPTSIFKESTLSLETESSTENRDFVEADSNIYVPEEYDKENIPGEPGIDYPTYTRIPDTSFRCSSQQYPGLYADMNTGCQVFHICQEDGREDSFLCPIGTVFNQKYFVCDWWYNFSCDTADSFYSLNSLIYELPDVDKKLYKE